MVGSDDFGEGIVNYREPIKEPLEETVTGLLGDH